MLILVIEDDSEALTYLAKAFAEAGHAVDVAVDGLEGYAMAQGGSYDVLVIDRMLPKLDGLSLIGGLRRQGVETPVLILSALGQVDDRVKGLRAGGDDKPNITQPATTGHAPDMPPRATLEKPRPFTLTCLVAA